MKNTWIVGAATLAAWNTPAFAATVVFQWNSAYIDNDTVRVWADAYLQDDLHWGFASSIFDVVGDDDAFSQGIDHSEANGLGRFFNHLPLRSGTTDGDDIRDIDSAQLPQLFDPHHFQDSTILDFFVFEYTITDFTERCITYTSEHLNFDVYIDDRGTSIPYDMEIIPTTFCIGNSSAVPLPSAAGLAGLGLLATGARRRRNALA